jgi:transposase InsO family protein
MPAAREFDQLALKFVDPIQHDYEVIRPIVLFEETVSARSEQLGLSRTTVGDKARRFVQQGMMGLLPAAATPHEKEPTYPTPIAAYILSLKKWYPPIHYREIVRILERKFGYHTNHHTVKQFLLDHPLPLQLELELPTFHQFEEAYQARWTVVRMYYEGWNKQSIAGCLKLARSHVHDLIAAFERDGFAGLEDQRTRPPTHPDNQLTLPFLKEVLDLQQEYPQAGRFRLRGLLEERSDHTPPSERTIGQAMQINRRFHGAPDPGSQDQSQRVTDTEGTFRRYRPTRRHQMWFVDIRYLVKHQGAWRYSLCLIEGYSRKILAGMVSEYQDLIAVLQLLHAALAEYGCPEAIVSDNGAVFTAHDYTTILTALEIEPHRIPKGRPWCNLIESQFRIQARLADAKFETTQTLAELQEAHAQFVQTFNTTAHWGHRERADDRTTPEAVLDWTRGRQLDPAQLRRVFGGAPLLRQVNRYGFVSIQRFYIYAEAGLSQKRVSIWMYDGYLRVEYQQTLLAHYRTEPDQPRRRLKAITHPARFRTRFLSPQLELLELDDEQWLKVRRRPYLRQPKRPPSQSVQLALFQILGVMLALLRVLPPK